MVAKFDEDIFTHPPHNPRVWLEVATNNGPDRNQVYGMLMG
jgi:hypothetical protein